MTPTGKLGLPRFLTMPCELCTPRHPKELWRDALVYVIDASTDSFPGFFRVILSRHVAEMSDLSPDEQHHVMDVVVRVEAAMREFMHPKKVNLAEFGNQVPHLHWHIIARFEDDAFFSDSVWSAPKRTTPVDVLRKRAEASARLASALPGILTKAFDH